MSDDKPTVVQEDDVWVIRVMNPTGKVQEFRCASESQAKQLAAILTPREQRPAAR